MDNTELHYVSYDPENLWTAMKDAYIEAGGDILYPGDEKEMLLRSVQAVIVQSFAAVDNAIRMSTLQYAVGEYLDIIGDNRGCIRKEATHASVGVTIRQQVTGKKYTVPAGTSCTYDGISFWLFNDDFVLDGVTENVSAVLVSQETGEAANSAPYMEELTLLNPIPEIISVMVDTYAGGGRDRETDEAYRERIRTYILNGVTTGPEKQYETAAIAADDDILDAKAVKGDDPGDVNIYLIIKDGSTISFIAPRVLRALNDDEVRPLTDNLSVMAADDVEYTLNVTYSYDGSDTKRLAIAAAVAEYQKWQDNKIGRAFNPNKLISMMYVAGAENVAIGAGSSFNGGAVVYTTIDPDERCKGTITATGG